MVRVLMHDFVLFRSEAEKGGQRNTRVQVLLRQAKGSVFFLRSGYFAGHRLRYKNLFCRSLISSGIH